MYASTRKEFYKRFWTRLIRRYWEREPARWERKAQKRNWLDFGAGRTGVKFGWSFHRGDRFSAEIYIDAGDAETNRIYLENLRNAKGLSREVIEKLSWEPLPRKRAVRIAYYHPANVEGLMMNTELVEELHQWATFRMRELEDIFGEAIRLL